MKVKRWENIEISRKEREADIFAAFFLISISTLADKFRFPEGLIKERLDFEKVKIKALK